MIYLPRVDTEAAAAPTQAKGEPPRGTESILLVEGEEDLRQLVTRVLGREGYEVVPVANGTEALSALEARTEPFDFLLTAAMMPGMSGPELAGRMAGSHSGTRILLTSGYESDAVREALDAPA